jgi:hypothetical protein
LTRVQSWRIGRSSTDEDDTMAYVSKENKQILVAAAKKVIPKDWKATFSVQHHSKLTVTIRKAPKQVLEDYTSPKNWEGSERLYVNEHSLESCYKGETLKVLKAIQDAINTGNHDRSDSQSDYFDVGWYTTIQFGEYDKKCEFI